MNRNSIVLRFHIHKVLLLVSIGLLVSACASTPPPTMQVPALVDQPVYQVEDVEFLATSEEMLKFVQHTAPADIPSYKRAWNLSYTMLDRFVFPFDYDVAITLPATETYRRQTGNCLSFSAMFVAMARSAGLEAWFQEVEVPPQWTNIDETYLVSRHVNAVVEGRGTNFIVDVSGISRADWMDTRRISDQDAFAQYYNNLGADALVGQDLSQAYGYFRKALELAPESAYIWSNLAVVLNRNGQFDDAEAVYLTALAINPQEQTALNNLHQLYFDAGQLEKAETIQARVDRYRKRNPWYLYHLSEEAVEEQRFGDAADLLEDAIRLNEREYRFHYALARVWVLTGDTQAARQSLDRAQKLAPSESEINGRSLNQIIFNLDS